MTGPRILREAIKDQFLAVIGEVKDLKPVEPKNRFQRRARTALALFSNLSSLFVYLILIVSALKLLFLFASHNGRIVQAFDNSKYTMTPMILFMILICLLTVRLLHHVSKFVRSYRVMSIIGCAIAIKIMVKTSIILFTATTLRGMGAAGWALFSGQLK